MLDNICQAVIFVTSLLAIFLVGRKNKWGFVVGFASQPFWFVTTYIHEQWGLFALS